jgi:AcrR family transcriptional regulator
MLLYHFRDKNDLVATVLNLANERSVQGIRALAPSRDVRHAVIDLWAALSTPEQARCGRLYVEAAALGVLGAEPFASVVGEANEVWLEAMAGHLVASGMKAEDGPRAARLVEAAFMGFQLDEPVEPAAAIRRSVDDLADAVVAVWA